MEWYLGKNFILDRCKIIDMPCHNGTSNDEIYVLHWLNRWKNTRYKSKQYNIWIVRRFCDDFTISLRVYHYLTCIWYSLSRKTRNLKVKTTQCAASEKRMELKNKNSFLISSNFFSHKWKTKSVVSFKREFHWKFSCKTTRLW